MRMPYARAGFNLEIDLSQAEIVRRETDPRLNDDYLGGRGACTRLFWDRVPPETDPFSPDNPLIFGVGLLTGTLAPGANRTAIITKSPQTELLTFSNLGGFWGAELKHAGYDILITSGSSPSPVYLWINDNQVEIRDARHLWGMDVRETHGAIRRELDQDKLQTICIGPAGENKVYAATVQHGFGSGASRTGVGAVMGAKNLKAIAVYGTRDLTIARPAEFHKVCAQILKKTDRAKRYWDDWAHEVGTWLLDGAYGYFDQARPMEAAGEWLEQFVEDFQTRKSTCYNCAIGCKSVIALPDGAYSTLKCQSWFNFLLACKLRDLVFSVKCYDLCESYGLDVISVANLIAFAIDLYERGILTQADTDGLRLRWGDGELAFTLIERIARREGIGDVLANGVYEAARQIGRGAEEHVQHIKKLEPIPYHITTPSGALRTATADKPDMTRTEGFVAAEGLEFPRDWKKEYVTSGFFSYPRDLERLFTEDYHGLEHDYEKVVPFTSYEADKNSLADSTGVCIFWTGFWRYNPITVGDHVRLISTALGSDMDESKAMMIAKRVGAVTRAYNVIAGISREDDVIPEGCFREPPGPSKVALDREKFDGMISKYYGLRGWNRDGVPTFQELNRLGLQDVGQELKRRGLL
jgi:aldehyde:ferredoxin oxidoreductase